MSHRGIVLRVLTQDGTYLLADSDMLHLALEYAHLNSDGYADLLLGLPLPVGLEARAVWLPDPGDDEVESEHDEAD